MFFGLLASHHSLKGIIMKCLDKVIKMIDKKGGAKIKLHKAGKKLALPRKE
jgi:hypothetical protein